MGKTMLPTKRWGCWATQSAACSLQRWHSAKSVSASAQALPCSTVLELITATSTRRWSMSASTLAGSNMRSIKDCAPGRGALAGVAPKPVNTVRLVDASNTSALSM